MRNFKLNYVLTLFVAFSILFTFNFCSSENDGTGNNVDNVIDSIKNEGKPKTEKAVESVIYTKYNLPLPVVLYRFLKKNKSNFDPDLLNPNDKVKNYNTSISKAFNLGVYSSALAYCTVFEQNQQAINYFVTTKRLSDELSIDNGYDETIIQRGNDNINNSDSLNKIATNAYWQACGFLEDNKKINILPFVIAGSWLESMYLTIHTVNIEEEGDQIMLKIAEQGVALNNLTQYLLDVMVDSNAFEINPEIQKLLNELKSIKAVYEEMSGNPKGVVITELQYQTIAIKVKAMREKRTK